MSSVLLLPLDMFAPCNFLSVELKALATLLTPRSRPNTTYVYKYQPKKKGNKKTENQANRLMNAERTQTQKSFNENLDEGMNRRINW